MNLKYGAIVAALALAFVACSDSSSTSSGGGDSSGALLSSGQVPLSSGQVPTSSVAPLSSGQTPGSSVIVYSSGSVFVPSSSSAALPPVGDLTIDQTTNPMKIMGTVHVEPAFQLFPTITGKVYFNGKEADELNISFLNTWGNYTGSGGSGVDVVLNSATVPNTLGAQLNVVDYPCKGRYLAVITMTDGFTTTVDTASYDVGDDGEVCTE